MRGASVTVVATTEASRDAAPTNTSPARRAARRAAAWSWSAVQRRWPIASSERAETWLLSDSADTKPLPLCVQRLFLASLRGFSRCHCPGLSPGAPVTHPRRQVRRRGHPPRPALHWVAARRKRVVEELPSRKAG